MKRFLAALSILAFVSLPAVAQDDSSAQASSETPRLGLHWAKGVHAVTPAATAGNMTFHHGPIMKTNAVQAIFWGKTWATKAGDKISGMDLWYAGFSGSKYAITSDE